MRFLLQPLSRTFAKLIEDESYKRFPLFAFVLATESDTNIFPDLLKYYGELHTLTGSHMLVFSPGVDTNEVPGEELPKDDITFLLRQVAESPGFEKEQARFFARQKRDTLTLARVCDISMSELPCVLFCASLEKPQVGIRWYLKRAPDAETVIRDFRTIVDEVAAARQAGKTDLLSEIERLQGRLIINSLVRHGLRYAGNFVTAVATALGVKFLGG